MNGRFLSVAVAVFGAFVASGESASAQAPLASWSSDDDGVASVQGGGFGDHYFGSNNAGGSYGAMPQRNYGPTPITPGYNRGAAANTWYNDLSGDKGGTYKDSPLDEFLKDMSKESYLRMEYMNWSFKKPGDELLGSATNASLNPGRICGWRISLWRTLSRAFAPVPTQRRSSSYFSRSSMKQSTGFFPAATATAPILLPFSAESGAETIIMRCRSR